MSATASRPPAAATTPLMRQYTRIKQDHPDAFLFFRLGDFYEMFLEDAVLAASLLGLTLTSRNKNDPDPVPMCGIPWHQRDNYVGRLLRLGHKVAICDQLEDPALARGIVQRGVTEILTPGSVTGETFLEPAANNFIAAIWPGEQVGVCLADASTGEMQWLCAGWPEGADVLSRLGVTEWVVPAPADLDPAVAARTEHLLRGLPGARSPVPAARFEALELIERRFGGEFTSALSTAADARAAVAALVDYLDRVQGGAALQLRCPQRWVDDETLRYDAATARHLELFNPGPAGDPRHTLWHHMNACVLAGGSRRLRAWLERPLVSIGSIEQRLDVVDAWRNAALGRAAFRDALKGLPDLERLAARVACAKATPRDLGAIRDCLRRMPQIAAALVAVGDSLGSMTSRLATDAALLARLETALVEDPPPVSREGGIFRAGFDARRDELDDLSHSGKRWIAELEASERTRTGIATLKVGYNRVFGYYLEVTRAHRDKVPADYERRQTLTTAERFVTPALKEREGEILGAEEKLRALEQDLFTDLRFELAHHVAGLLEQATALAMLDATAALAEVATRSGWVRPTVDDSDRLLIQDGRHPVVERLLPAGEFVPNSIELNGTHRQIVLLTGPNMGGKSTYLRQIALIVLLAQAGSFVPAASARIGRVDRLFTRVGSADRLGAGQSTFMVEMQETAAILNAATSRSLVLLDELGRGTATYDGLALAWAVTEYLHAAEGPRPRTLFATHYHELTQLQQRLKRLVNAHVAVLERGDQVVFLHQVVDGAADRSYGIHVARLAGLPASVLTRAEEVLGELERERTVEHLEAPRGRARPGGDAAQLGLFTAAEHPLLAELRATDPNRLTPLEALERLTRWRERWGSAPEP